MDAREVIKAIRKSGKRFYVYCLHRPDGTPFYVGVGTGRRIFDHAIYARRRGSASLKIFIIRKIWRAGEEIDYRVAGHFDLRSDAECLEAKMIREIGRRDRGEGPLANSTDGGEGAPTPSKEVLRRRSEWMKREWAHGNRSAAHLHSPEVKKRASEAQKGTSHRSPSRTRKWTAEQKRRMSALISADPVSRRPGIAEKISAANRGRKHDSHWTRDPAKKEKITRGQHPRARPIIVDGVVFPCIEDAAEMRGVARSTICNWLSHKRHGARFLGPVCDNDKVING